VGHNCESGDLLTPAKDDPHTIQPRLLSKAQIGSKMIIGGAGAYCASMRASSYNSFPDAREIVL
jgi:diaminopimelate decarboxylase